MKAEAHEAADQKLDEFAARGETVIAGITPERVIRDGDTSEEILKLIDEDEDYRDARAGRPATGKEGPGPLVAGIGKAAERLSHSGRDRSGGISATRNWTRCRSRAAIDLAASKAHLLGMIWTNWAEQARRHAYVHSDRNHAESREP